MINMMSIVWPKSNLTTVESMMWPLGEVVSLIMSFHILSYLDIHCCFIKCIIKIIVLLEYL